MVSPEMMVKVMRLLEVYFELKVPPSTDQIKIYEGIFNAEDITDKQLNAAVLVVCARAEKKFGMLPTVKEILDAARPSGTFRAVDFWRLILKKREKALNRQMYGSGELVEPKWLDTPEGRALRRTMETLGGWEHFCSEKPTDFKRKDFIQYYEGYYRDESIRPAMTGQEQKALNG